MKTILVSFSDDRFGRKNGLYGKTQDVMSEIIGRHPEFGISAIADYKWNDIVTTQFYRENQVQLDDKDAARNGRVYKPWAILRELEGLQDGDFLMYNDCSPEIWLRVKPDFDILDLNIGLDLCREANGILALMSVWSDKPMLLGDLGKATHKNFTLNRCMRRMDMMFYEDAYQAASGMIFFQKSSDTMDFVKEWLKWNLIDECCSLGYKDKPGDATFWNEESHAVFGKPGYKMGHRHDQSIFGLLLAARNQKCLLPVYDKLPVANFLQYCRKDASYKFAELNPALKIGDQVKNKQDTLLEVYEILPEGYVVGQNSGSKYIAPREQLKLIGRNPG